MSGFAPPARIRTSRSAPATVGIRFVYSTEIDCVHNDQTADLERYCSFQERGARDTVSLCASTRSCTARPPSPGSTARSGSTTRLGWCCAKTAKAALSRPWAARLFRGAIRLAERVNAREAVLRRGYRAAIGLATFRGWRTGLDMRADGFPPQGAQRAGDSCNRSSLPEAGAVDCAGPAQLG